jgi:putative sugar O-methyltransferase
MEILSEARDHYREAAAAAASEPTDQPQNSNRWTLFQNDMQGQIETHGDISQAIKYAQTCGFDHRGDIYGNKSKIQFCRHCLRYEYPHFSKEIDRFSDSHVSIPSTLLKLSNGVLISDIMYFHMFYILTALTYCPKIETVCEIGGGYGGPARFWLTNPIHPIKNYTIIDLPESLFYAEVFLRSACPNLKIVYCMSEQDFHNTNDNTCYLVPLHLARFTSSMTFDLVTNTGSLAELSDEWVVYWSQWLNTQRCDIFYSHNYFGIPIDRLYESRNIIAPITPSGWRVGQLRINHPLMLLQSADRNAAEVILIRKSTDNPSWIYDIQRLRADEKLTITDFAYYVFNLPTLEHINILAEITLVKKTISDLCFLPKELFFITDRIITSKAFEGIPEDEKDFILNLSANLQEAYEANYPQGRHVNIVMNENAEIDLMILKVLNMTSKGERLHQIKGLIKSFLSPSVLNALRWLRGQNKLSS